MQQRPSSTGRRPMTRREYEAMRQQQRQNRLAIAILGAFAVAIVVAVILILRPKPQRDVAVPASVEAAQAVAEASDEQAPDAAEEPDAGDGEAIADAGEADESAAEDAGAASVETPAGAVAEVAAAPRASGSLRSVRMRVVGDIMFSMAQMVYARDSGFDFHNQFELIADLLQNADYTMGNMEGTVGMYKGKAYSGYPLFNCPDAVLQTLKDDGVDFLTLANNHMLDRWFEGMKNTVGWVEQYGFDHVGAYRTREERETPVIYEVGGIKFGFVAYTHTTNTQETVCDPDAVEYGVPYLYKSDIEGDIKRLREAGAEVVIAFPHWGKEYVREPDSNQKKYARKLASAGADIIIGSHSHMVQPMGYQTVEIGGVEKKVFTMFSMGNFISDHTPQYTDNGVILDFTVNEHADGTFTCDDVGYIPTYTWKQDGAISVLPSGRYLNERPAGMDDENYNRMVASFQEIVDLLGSDFQVITG